jgi:hypothetical protein
MEHSGRIRWCDIDSIHLYAGIQDDRDVLSGLQTNEIATPDISIDEVVSWFSLFMNGKMSESVVNSKNGKRSLRMS